MPAWRVVLDGGTLTDRMLAGLWTLCVSSSFSLVKRASFGNL